MSRLLSITGPHHKAMIKEAFVGALMKGVGKVIVKNPFKSWVGYENIKGLGETSSNMMDAAARGRNIGRSITGASNL